MRRKRSRSAEVVFHSRAPHATGSEMAMFSGMGLIDKRPNGCWDWTGRVNVYGYGHTPTGELAHRVVYEHLVGAILPGYAVHHECRNKRCVNPDHLTAMPQGEHTGMHNSLRAALLHGDAAI